MKDILVLSTAELCRLVNRVGSGLGRAEATRLGRPGLPGACPLQAVRAGNEAAKCRTQVVFPPRESVLNFSCNQKAEGDTK